MTRIDIINHLIKNGNYKTYLEIGARDLNDCFNWIDCETKTSVDPKTEIHFDYSRFNYDYSLTSDSFFHELEAGELNLQPDHKWDIIFIDGLHLAEQVDRDIQNSLNHLQAGGTIIIHDCKPMDSDCARELHDGRYLPNGLLYPWTGTTWKAFYKWMTSRSDVQMWTVDTDWGVGIIRRGERLLPPKLNPFYEYQSFAKNMVHDLNLITPEEFYKLFQ